MKKIVALSTSVHLAVIGIIIGVGMYRIVCVHILLHAFIKASMFVSSGNTIHIDGEQDLRGCSDALCILRIVMLLGIGGSVLGTSKEVLMGMICLVGVVVVLLSWTYTKHIMREFNGLVICGLLMVWFLMFFGVGGLVCVDR